jgi:hypothetical protein
MDYIQMHNAQFMQEMAKLRIAIIRKNAQLVDWLAEHVGSTQLQLIHRRPTFQTQHGDPNASTESGLFFQIHLHVLSLITPFFPMPQFKLM